MRIITTPIPTVLTDRTGFPISFHACVRARTYRELLTNPSDPSDVTNQE